MNSSKTQDVKDLIKQQIKTNSSNKEVKSPYAKYNSRSQLMCLVCGTSIKSAIVWLAHEKKRSHQEKLTRLKEKQMLLPDFHSSPIDTHLLMDIPHSSGSLPERFFDDPVADAKARNVEYRDKDAEEWLAFVNEISAVTFESQQIIAEDKEEAALETQIEQTNEQIRHLERVVELDKEKKDQLEDQTLHRSGASDDDSSDEEFSPLIWRTKNSLI